MEFVHVHGKLRFRCPACGIKAWIHEATERIVCHCGYMQLGGIQPGLGDWIAAGLHRCGITRYRYQRIKKILGLNPSCRCPERQAWINWLGRWVAAYVRSLVRWW